MRILYLNNDYIGSGAEAVMHSIANEMKRRGNEVFFAVANDNGISEPNVFKVLCLRRGLYSFGRSMALPNLDQSLAISPDSSISKRLFSSFSLILPNIDPSAYFYLSKVFEKIKPDLIHCHNISFLSFAPIKVAQKYNIPVIITIHDYWPVCLLSTLHRPNGEICEKSNWSNCDFCIPSLINIDQRMSQKKKILESDNITFIAVSNFVKKVMLRFGYINNNIKVILNGIDTNLFTPSKSSDYKNMVLFVGRPIDYKGISYFIKASEVVRQKRPDINFVLIGGKIDNNHIISLDKIPFNDLIEQYQKALCVCVPSIWHDPCPIVPLEAMACGTPVIASAVGGLPEEIEDGKTGFLVKSKDYESIAEKIIYLAENEDVRIKFGLNARNVAEEKFSLDNMIKKYEKLYYDL